MSIITQPLQPDSKPILQSMVSAQKKDLDNLYKTISRRFEALANFVWHNDDYSPQEVFSAYGTDGGELCKLSAAASIMIGTYTGEPVDIVPEGKSLTVSEDGNVTVVDA